MDTPTSTAETETVRVKPVRRWPWIVLGIVLGFGSCGVLLVVLGVIAYLKETREQVRIPTFRMEPFDDFEKRRRAHGGGRPPPGVTQERKHDA